MEQSNVYLNILTRKKELVNEIEKVKEDILLRSKEKDVENLEKLRGSNTFWSDSYNEDVDRYSEWVNSYKDQKEALVTKRSKLSDGFFKSFFNSSKIADLDKAIADLDKRIKQQEENVEQAKIKVERQKLIHNTSYDKNEIWNFLESRGLTEETFKEKLKTIPDMETLNKTLAELERELEAIDISLEVYDEGIETKLQESINKTSSYNLENPNNVVPNANVNIDSQIEDEEEHTMRSK